MAYIGNSPANVGNYQQVDDISGSFNGTLVTFNLTASSTAISPAKDGQLLVSVDGVMQEPDSSGTNGFKVSGSTIVFSSAPASSSTFWAIYQGQNVDVGTPSAGVVGLTELSATGTKSSTTYLSGANTWTEPAGGATGGSTDDIFYENGQTVTANYTITTNKNAMSAGPITINTGISVTVPTGSVWVIL